MAGCSSIVIVNNAAATLRWRVKYDGGESPLSGDVLEGQTNEIGLGLCPGLQTGQQCWPLIEPVGGTNHDCGDDVPYDPNGGRCTYVISGVVDNISCALQRLRP